MHARLNPTNRLPLFVANQYVLRTHENYKVIFLNKSFVLNINIVFL